MSALVAERRVADLVDAAGRRPLTVVARGRRRGRWSAVHADAAVDALAAAGPAAIVLARAPEADPGAVALAAVARMMGAAVVRLPSGLEAAAWCVAVALHPDFEHDDLVRRLEALVGLAQLGGDTPAVPSLRPGVLSRWSSRAWRPCGRCGGGGALGGACARCGAATAAGAR